MKTHSLLIFSLSAPLDGFDENFNFVRFFMGLYFFRSLTLSFVSGDLTNFAEVGVTAGGFERMDLSLLTFLTGLIMKDGILGFSTIVKVILFGLKCQKLVIYCELRPNVLRFLKSISLSKP